MADLARQGSLADHANNRARRLVESWVVRGEEEDAPAEEGRGGVGADGTAVAASDTGDTGGGGGGDGEERGHPQSLGLLLALCGLDADARDLLGGFEAPSSWPLLSAPPPAAADEAATAAAGVEGGEEAELRSEPGGEGEGGNAEVHASSVPLVAAAVAEAAAANDTLFAATAAATAAGTPPAAYSLLDYEEAARGEATGAPVEPGDPLETAGQQEQGLEEQALAVPATAYFDDEADFLEKSASEYAELMDDQEENDEYLSGFSFAPLPAFSAEATPSWAAGGGDRMSEADRFRQQRQQRLAERRQAAALDEGVGVADAPRPPSPSIRAGSAGQATRPQEGTAAEGVSSTGGARPPSGGEGAEPGIIRRANLLEGGQTVAIFDLETTGLGPEKHRVIQLAGKVCVPVCLCVSVCWGVLGVFGGSLVGCLLIAPFG